MSNIDLSQLSKEDLIKLVAKLNERPARKLSLKVSAKGACSLYGMGRWPVTLYKSQWEQLLDAADDIRAFLKANDAALTSKADAD